MTAAGWEEQISTPVVSVVVPVRDGAALLPALLAALAAQIGPRFEVVIVDNGSRDGSPDVAAGHPLQPTVIREAKPGSYAARNAALAAVRAPIIAFTDVDCRPLPGWLAAGVAALDDRHLDLVGGAVEQRLSAQPSVWERYNAALYLNQSAMVSESGFGATANLFVRTDVARSLGGFDASLHSGGDVDFCWRAKAAGHRLAFCPDALVAHLPRKTRAEVWALHRRVGAGMRVLAQRGERPPLWRDPWLLMPLGHVANRVAEHAGYVRRRHLLPVHAYATTAGVVGWLSGH